MSKIREDESQKAEKAMQKRQERGFGPLEISDDLRLCFTCNIAIGKEMEMELKSSSIKLNVLIQSSSSSCFLCNHTDGLARLELCARVDVFVKKDIYIPYFVKTCPSHLDDKGNIENSYLNSLRYINRSYILKGEELSVFLQGLRSNTLNNCSKNFADENSFTEEEFKVISPITKTQFQDILTFCDPLRGSYLTHINKKDVLTFLCKMRQGLSDEFLALIFNYTSRQSASLAVGNVRKSLMLRFVPKNIGFGAIKRTDFIDQHVPSYANILYNSSPEIRKAITYVDGTYTMISKSTNFEVLRQTYCVHKGRHLIKPILIVAADGYILDIQGPYFSDSRNNDARILKYEYEKDTSEMSQWYQPGDIFIVDRGYRDAIPFFEGKDFTYKMPALLSSGKKQLTTEEANNSRLVTKTRFVVEARNGHIKSKFKFLRDTVPITHAPNIGDFYRIADAIINRYHLSIKMRDLTADIAQQMLERARKENHLQLRVEQDNLRRQNANWSRVNEDALPDFPRLTLAYLNDFTVGTYQLSLAPSYIQDKLKREATEELQFDQFLQEPGLLRFRIYSRFRNATKHQLWINFVGNELTEPIRGYYCTCKVGARTLGACAHVVSVLWYLGFARFENVKYPWTTLLTVILDAGERNISAIENEIEPLNY